VLEWEAGNDHKINYNARNNHMHNYNHK